MALKSADLGHLTSQTDVHCTWLSRLEEVRHLKAAWRMKKGCIAGPPVCQEVCVTHCSHFVHTFTHALRICLQELFLQGDQERQMGQPISPLMDRSKTGITKSQVCCFLLDSNSERAGPLPRWSLRRFRCQYQETLPIVWWGPVHSCNCCGPHTTTANHPGWPHPGLGHPHTYRTMACQLSRRCLIRCAHLLPPALPHPLHSLAASGPFLNLPHRLASSRLWRCPCTARLPRLCPTPCRS